MVVVRGRIKKKELNQKIKKKKEMLNKKEMLKKQERLEFILMVYVFICEW